MNRRARQHPCHRAVIEVHLVPLLEIRMVRTVHMFNALGVSRAVLQLP